MRILMAVWAGLICLSTTCSAAELYSKHIEGWLAGAYSNDATGQFSHCAATVQAARQNFYFDLHGAVFVLSLCLDSPGFIRSRPYQS
jgi:hypothetical protein